MTPHIRVIDLAAAADTTASGTDEATNRVRGALRTLVQTAREGGRDAGRGRSFAVLGEFGGTEPDNDRAVAHDRVGRLAVRLAVDIVIAVGTTRIVRALHQGAVMEGSWGDEARMVADADSAVEMLLGEIGDGDVVLVAGDGSDLSAVARNLLDDQRCVATLVELPVGTDD
ncbi:glutamate ligase domain-containing protein [Williamsia sp. MIQD14]|uniref:glutamate ligase domain-containing protein n=1 Tax=Williamsia sp. MIQD14 TaxID=3425703 RepID=UPI003DA10F7A